MVGGRLFQKYWTGDLESAVTKECPELSSSSVYGGGLVCLLDLCHSPDAWRESRYINLTITQALSHEMI